MLIGECHCQHNSSYYIYSMCTAKSIVDNDSMSVASYLDIFACNNASSLIPAWHREKVHNFLLEGF